MHTWKRRWFELHNGRDGDSASLSYFEVVDGADPTVAGTRRLKGKVTVKPQSVDTCQVFMRQHAFQFGASRALPEHAALFVCLFAHVPEHADTPSRTLSLPHPSPSPAADTIVAGGKPGKRFIISCDDEREMQHWVTMLQSLTVLAVQTDTF